MITALAATSIWKLLVMLGTVIAFFGGLILTIQTTKKLNKNIKYSKKNGFEISNGELVKVSPHKNCEHKSDIVLLMRMQQDILKKIYHIEDIEIIRDQMNLAEEKLDKIMTIIKKQFIKLLRNKNTHINNYDPINTHPYKYYILSLNSLSKELILQYRFLCRENHLLEKSEAEFETYLHSKVSYLYAFAVSFLDDIYWAVNEEFPTRDEVSNFNKEIENDIKKIAYNLIRDSKSIAQKYQKEIEKLYKNFEDEVRKYL